MAKQTKQVVTVADAQEHGFYGQVREHDPNEQYTVKGVTGGTAKATDTPSSAKSEGTRSRS